MCFSSPRGLGDLTLYSKQGRETLQSRPYYSCEIERQITQHLFLFFQSLFSYVWLIILPVWKPLSCPIPIFGRSSKVLIETMITIYPFFFISLSPDKISVIFFLKEGKQMHRVNPACTFSGVSWAPHEAEGHLFLTYSLHNLLVMYTGYS